MDINLVREAVTVVSFIIFVVIIMWAWSDGARQGFEQAARLPLEEGDEFPGAAKREGRS